MLNGGGYDVLFAGKTQFYRPVVGFSSAGSEENFLFTNAQQPGNGPPGLLEDPPGLVARTVDGPGIAEGLCHHLRHPLCHLGIGGPGRGVVKIDHKNSPFLFSQYNPVPVNLQPV